jgi:hypothetical protein
MVLGDVIWEFECKIYWFIVSPISFNNSWLSLLSGCICPYVINMGSINCCNFFKLKFHWSIKLWSSFGCVQLRSNMLILKSPIIIVRQEIGIRFKNFWRWIMNINNDNVESMYIAIIWISFLIFALNVVAI